MSDSPSPPPVPRAAIYPLRLLRLKEGEHAIIWITHHLPVPNVRGLFTRHDGQGSQIIPPEEASVRVKGRPGVWKGYLSAVEWRLPEKLWVPVIVEITERAEQDLRGKVTRGQVWKLWKGPKDKNKKIPLRATFLESRDPAGTPSAIDVLPKLRNDIFRQADVSLEHLNPLPDLVIVAPEPGLAPGEKAAPLPGSRDDTERKKFLAGLIDGIGKEGGVNGFSSRERGRT